MFRNKVLSRHSLRLLVFASRGSYIFYFVVSTSETNCVYGLHLTTLTPMINHVRCRCIRLLPPLVHNDHAIHDRELALEEQKRH
jgi:hypothetical protein